MAKEFEKLVIEIDENFVLTYHFGRETWLVMFLWKCLLCLTYNGFHEVPLSLLTPLLTHFCSTCLICVLVEAVLQVPTTFSVFF